MSVLNFHCGRSNCKYYSGGLSKRACACCLKSRVEGVITVHGPLIIFRCNAIWWRGRVARKQQPRQREVWDTISLFHSAGRPSNTDVIKPLRKLCHYTLDKRLFDFASWHCSAADALNTDLNTCTNLCAGLLRHVIAGSRSSCFKTACLFSEADSAWVPSAVQPPFEICYGSFRQENRFSELVSQVFALLLLQPALLYLEIFNRLAGILWFCYLRDCLRYANIIRNILRGIVGTRSCAKNLLRFE